MFILQILKNVQKSSKNSFELTLLKGSTPCPGSGLLPGSHTAYKDIIKNIAEKIQASFELKFKSLAGCHAEFHKSQKLTQHSQKSSESNTSHLRHSR